MRHSGTAAPLAVTVADFSAAGCRIEAPCALPSGCNVQIGLSGAGRVTGKIVWSRGGNHGVQFDRQLRPEEIACAFQGAQVVALFPSSEAGAPIATEPKFSPKTRAGILIGSASTLWIGIAALAFGVA